MDTNQSLRKELTEYLENDRTHIGLAKAVRDLPEKLINKKTQRRALYRVGTPRTRPHRPA